MKATHEAVMARSKDRVRKWEREASWQDLVARELEACLDHLDALSDKEPPQIEDIREEFLRTFAGQKHASVERVMRVFDELVAKYMDL